MKSAVIALLLIATTAFAVGAIYSSVRPPPSEIDCSMAWLTRELQLSNAQVARIRTLHVRLCPLICGAGPSGRHPDAVAVQACHQATLDLVNAVCAELTPPQRERYCQLVAPCLRAGGDKR